MKGGEFMTLEELNLVRELDKKKRDTERLLKALRISAENIVPIIDGLPHSTTIKSRVEKIALRAVETETKLEKLRGEIIQAKSDLADKIMSNFSEPVIQTLLMLRYVECLSFRETARRMHYSLRHIFNIHDKFLKDCIR